MPYIIEEKGDKFILSNKNTGRVIAAHKTKAKASAQMKSLYAHEGSQDRIKGNVDINTED